MGQDTQSDNELMVKVQHSDDQNAFSILAKRHYKKWYYFAMRMVVDQETAEDIVQDTCLKIWQRRKSWQPTAQFNTWVFRMIFNQCVDNLKSPRYKNKTTIDMNRLSQVIPLSEDNQRSVEIILHALNQFNANDRALFILHHYHQMQASELCEIFELTKQALESRLYRMRKTLREQLL